MNSTITGPVAAYLAQVRAELNDLPAGELEDVLDDVTSHLNEVAGEFDGGPTRAGLEERLGSPAQYAAELRTAAGYPPRGEVPPPYSHEGRSAFRWGIVALGVAFFFGLIGMADMLSAGWFLAAMVLPAIPALLGVRALRGADPRIVTEYPTWQRFAAWFERRTAELPESFRRDLVAIGQPVWWVVRGGAIGGGLLAVVAQGVGPAVIVGAIAGAVGSVWLARKTQTDRRLLWYVLPLNVVAVLLTLFAVFNVSDRVSYYDNGDYRGTSYRGDINGLSYEGNRVSNIYLFDQQGKPVSARLYDQGGQPISLDIEDCKSQQTGEMIRSNVFPHRAVDGSFSFPDAEHCVDSDKPPFKVPPASGIPTEPTTSPSPTPPAPTIPITPTGKATIPAPTPTR